MIFYVAEPAWPVHAERSIYLFSESLLHLLTVSVRPVVSMRPVLTTFTVLVVVATSVSMHPLTKSTISSGSHTSEGISFTYIRRHIDVFSINYRITMSWFQQEIADVTKPSEQLISIIGLQEMYWETHAWFPLFVIFRFHVFYSAILYKGIHKICSHVNVETDG